MNPQPTRPPATRAARKINHVMNVILALCGIGAVGALVLEYGFREPVVSVRGLRIAEGIIVAIFVLDRLVRLLLAADKRAFLRENVVDFALMVLAVGVVAFNFEKVLSLGALYVFITQAYILVALVLRGVSLNLRFAGSGIHPSVLLASSFGFLILAGSGLLMLPVAVREGYYTNWYYLDSLFTATSATCVTGLVVRNTGGHFTAFGQAVILALIQCGGLGIMLFGTVLGLLVGKTLTTKQSETLGQMLSADGIGKLVRVALFVILITFAFEIVGALGFYPMFADALDTRGEPLSKVGAIWHSAFHSVSSFCNAGFALYEKNVMQGAVGGWKDVEPLRSRWQIMGVMAPLIVLGGIGFPVLQDCAGYLAMLVKRAIVRIRLSGAILAGLPPRRPLTLHSKVVLTTSLALIVAGAGVLLLIEPRGERAQRVGLIPLTDRTTGSDWQQLPLSQRAREAVFQSITARTAGFNTINIAELSDPGKLWMCMLMSVGGSPASTAGGMKTVTFALLILIAVTQLRRRGEVEAFHRSVPLTIVARAVAVAVLYLSLVVTVTILLCIAQGAGYRFIDLLFEACSACGTVGLSTGVTKTLSEFGKCVIIAGMFIGRIGPLTLLAALTYRLRRVEYAYPQENLVIG
ncbi:MAG: TrkH family potassium uptake protein [Planctomycetota bacterium]|jgi:trk system potassium uptake protein TrkH